LRADGNAVTGAYYRCLKDGAAAGYAGVDSPQKLGREPPDLSTLADQLEKISAAIARLAAGEAGTDPVEGLCEERGFAQLVRLQEARMAPTAGDDGEAAEVEA
jgi:hypothetical protein